MRVSKATSAENRERILQAASRLFRECGLSGVGVDALTEAAGLTHGSVYSQFGSKQALAEAALAQVLAEREAASTEDGTLPVDQFIAWYLTPSHRDAPGDGCALAALGCEVARQPAPIRRVFTESLRRSFRRLAGRLAGAAAEDRAIAVLSTLVGAMVLARMVDDPTLSDRILAASRTVLTDRVATVGERLASPD
jgi:TetR/AcrR family transcriptional regulator, transcriptional repressor for nem operon